VSDVSVILLPRSIVDAIAETGESWGTVGLKVEDGVAVATALALADRGVRPVSGAWLDDHFTKYASTRGSAIWYRADPGLADAGRPFAAQGRGLPLAEFKQRRRGRWTPSSRFSVTVERGDSEPVVACWSVSEAGARLLPHEIIDEDDDLLAPLDEGWPRSRLVRKRACVIGVGSIGAAACESLAAYGLRHLTLVDPGRLLRRNFARHRAHRRDHGRRKVNAVKDLLEERDPLMEVQALALDIDHDADQLRPVIRDNDIVVICSDGTRSRRVGMHLAFRARRPVVLACVQDAGAFGEILRLVPGRTGCLLCNRKQLGNALEPEPLGFELDYDLPGELGHPMSAVTGDLWLVGAFAAKAAVATLLQTTGIRDQRLPGDMALIALRPEPERPPPFDRLTEAGAIVWRPTAPSRPECPTCGEALL
jgi:molybdopterin-synthase adenylyltransferase